MTKPTYDLKSVHLPRLAGTALNGFISLLESSIGRTFLIPGLLRDAGVEALRKQAVTGTPTYLPTWTAERSPANQSIDLEDLPGEPAAASPGFVFSTIADYAAAYRSGRITPLQAAIKFAAAVRESNQGEQALRAIIALEEDDLLEQARLSSERWERGRPLSPLDGVPIAIKDEMDVQGYLTTAGTKFLGRAPATKDSTAAGRLRQAGALLPGKANMHEIGIGVTGFNAHHGTARNPYHPGHYTGGSSSGPAAATAAGLTPASLGADGGGSIRIPAAFCGLVGLKPTFGRVSEAGAYPLDWSVAHIGPIASCARDAAMVYAVIAGSDPADPNTHHQPDPSLTDFENTDLRGLKLGIFTPWFEHASEHVVAACRTMLDQLADLGAEIIEVSIPGLEAMRVAHTILITSEMNTSLDRFHHVHRTDYSLEVRANLALARAFTAIDYVKAAQVRTQAMQTFAHVLDLVDVIITPATGITAPAIRPDVLPMGESDLSTLMEIMRFSVAANLTGLPAITFPAGYDPIGLPVGLQAIGRPWREDVLLRLAHASESRLEKRKPAVFFHLFD